MEKPRDYKQTFFTELFQYIQFQLDSIWIQQREGTKYF